MKGLLLIALLQSPDAQLQRERWEELIELDLHRTVIEEAQAMDKAQELNTLLKEMK